MVVYKLFERSIFLSLIIEYLKILREVGHVISPFGKLILNLAISEGTSGVDRDNFASSILKDGL